MHTLEDLPQRQSGIWRKPYISIPLLFLLLFCGLSIFSMVGLAVIATMQGIDLKAAQNLLLSPELYPNSRNALFIFQAISTPVGAMLLPGMLYTFYFDRTGLQHKIHLDKFNGMAIALIILLVPAFMPFDSLIIEWNKTIDLGPLSDWAGSLEKSAEKTTLFLTNFSSLSELILGLIVVGVITAIGEEYFFRGLVQNMLSRAFGANKHMAIWMAAFLFSLIHMQFYGFFPRMLLGAMFGYVYVWSGSLWTPIIGHCTNNSLTLIMFYLNNKGMIEIDPEDTSTIPLKFSLISGFVSISLMYFLYRNQFTKANDNN